MAWPVRALAPLACEAFPAADGGTAAARREGAEGVPAPAASAAAGAAAEADRPAEGEEAPLLAASVVLAEALACEPLHTAEAAALISDNASVRDVGSLAAHMLRVAEALAGGAALAPEPPVIGELPLHALLERTPWLPGEAEQAVLVPIVELMLAVGLCDPSLRTLNNCSAMVIALRRGFDSVATVIASTTPVSPSATAVSFIDMRAEANGEDPDSLLGARGLYDVVRFGPPALVERSLRRRLQRDKKLRGPTAAAQDARRVFLLHCVDVLLALRGPSDNAASLRAVLDVARRAGDGEGPPLEAQTLAASEDRCSVLHLAALRGLPGCVAQLAACPGVDCNLAANRHRSTPLHALASNSACPRCAAILVDAGADIEATDFRGRTPLWLAALVSCSLALVRRLLSLGANADTHNAAGSALLAVVRRRAASPDRVATLEPIQHALEAAFRDSGLDPDTAHSQAPGPGPSDDGSGSGGYDGSDDTE